MLWDRVHRSDTSAVSDRDGIVSNVEDIGASEETNEVVTSETDGSTMAGDGGGIDGKVDVIGASE